MLFFATASFFIPNNNNNNTHTHFPNTVATLVESLADSRTRKATWIHEYSKQSLEEHHRPRRHSDPANTMLFVVFDFDLTSLQLSSWSSSMAAAHPSRSAVSVLVEAPFARSRCLLLGVVLRKCR